VSDPRADLLAELRVRSSRSRYRDDPVLFFREVLGVEPWSREREVLEAVAGHAKVAVRSGHKVSKSHSAMGLALWWVGARAGARVVLTSAAGLQVRTILWRELRLLHANARVPLGGNMHLEPDTGYQLADGREVFGFTTDKPERMSGISGPNNLFILDEASGIPEQIFEAVEGNLAGGGKLVMFSNPTATSGTFYEAFHERRDIWYTIHISSEESPNVAAGEILVPGLATREWVEERRRDWGEDHPLFQVRVRGNFPTQSKNAIITVAMVEAAIQSWSEARAEGRLVLGVDVARFGDDDTVIFPVRGSKALPAVTLRSMDGAQIAGRVAEVARQLSAPGETPLARVDVIGVGASVFDFLRYAKSGPEVEAVNVAVAATVPEYALMRDQLWFGLAKWLKEGGSIPSDSKLEAELVAPTYTFDQRGRIKVEPKYEIKKRLKRSPDRADALAMAVGQVIQPKPASYGVSFIGGGPNPDRDVVLDQFRIMAERRPVE
jgi:hypothetical protein